MKLEKFYKELERHRKPRVSGYDRITHCYLSHEENGEVHHFEVRGWKPIEDGVLNISLVNWTIVAGSCSLFLTEELVDQWDIYDK